MENAQRISDIMDKIMDIQNEEGTYEENFTDSHLVQIEKCLVEYFNETEAITMEQNLQGKCAKCGSDDLEYGNTELDNDYMYYEYTCQNCKHDGTELYILKYDKTD